MEMNPDPEKLTFKLNYEGEEAGEFMMLVFKEKTAEPEPEPEPETPAAPEE